MSGRMGQMWLIEKRTVEEMGSGKDREGITWVEGNGGIGQKDREG